MPMGQVSRVGWHLVSRPVPAEMSTVGNAIVSVDAEAQSRPSGTLRPYAVAVSLLGAIVLVLTCVSDIGSEVGLDISWPHC
jgi:hypothetical protein